MSRGAIALWIAGMLVAPAAPALAQTPLSLAQAIDAAIAENPALRAARATHEQARDEHRAAEAEWCPRINFSEVWRRSTAPVDAFGALLNSRQFTAADFAVDHLNHPGSVDLFARRLSVSQVLFDGGRTRSMVTLAARQADAAGARVSIAEADIALKVTELYGRLIAGAAAADAAKAALNWALEDQALAEARRHAGTATDADVLSMSVHVADLRQRQLQAETDIVTARAGLNELMGVEPSRDYVLALPPVPATAPELTELVAAARRARPELAEADHAVAIAESSAAMARSAWWPALAAEAGYEWDGRDFSTRASAWSVAAEVRFSLSTGGAEPAKAAAARAGVAAARASREATAAAIEVEVLTLRQQWLLARARIDAGRAAVADARESLRITRQRYAAGLASMTDVLAASSAALAADAQQTSNEVTLVTAWSALERAIGRVAFRDNQ